jgi:hypothetical protein
MAVLTASGNQVIRLLRGRSEVEILPVADGFVCRRSVAPVSLVLVAVPDISLLPVTSVATF